jgi:hypothetical protein
MRGIDRLTKKRNKGKKTIRVKDGDVCLLVSMG